MEKDRESDLSESCDEPNWSESFSKSIHESGWSQTSIESGDDDWFPKSEEWSESGDESNCSDVDDD